MAKIFMQTLTAIRMSGADGKNTAEALDAVSQAHENLSSLVTTLQGQIVALQAQVKALQ